MIETVQPGLAPKPITIRFESTVLPERLLAVGQELLSALSNQEKPRET